MSETNHNNTLKHPILFGVVLVLVSLAIFLLFLAPFSFELYNKGETAKTKDVNLHNKDVYGDGPDQPARQTKNTYTDTPEGQKRADAIRDKFFGEGATPETSAVVVDSAAAPKDSTKAEPKK
jgi:hypothetical protein